MIRVETASDRKKRRRLLHSYEEGRIHALLRRVERKSYYKNLPKAIDRYKPKDGYEQSLLSVMKEGLEFLTLNTASWNTATIPSTRRTGLFAHVSQQADPGHL